MSTSEYLSFIPQLLYGAAVIELFGQWRRFFDKQYRYWPYVLVSLIFTELAIWNIYLFLSEIRGLSDVSYYKYWLFIIRPICFMLMVHALTPDSDIKDTAGYFKKRLPIVFGLFTIYIALHFDYALSDPLSDRIIRVASVLLALVIAITKRINLIYVFGAIWIVSLFFR